MKRVHAAKQSGSTNCGRMSQDAPSSTTTTTHSEEESLLEKSLQSIDDEIAACLRWIAQEGKPTALGRKLPPLTEEEQQWDAYSLFVRGAVDSSADGKQLSYYIGCVQKLRDKEQIQADDPKHATTAEEKPFRERLYNVWGPEMTVILALTNIGCLLLRLPGFTDEYTAVQLFRLCATREIFDPKCLCNQSSLLTFHESTFLYGAALVRGTGGIPRDISQGMAYLHRAAYGGMGLLSYFLLGSIYETGANDNQNNIDPNLTRAEHFYDLVAQEKAAQHDSDDKYGPYMARFWHPEMSVVRIAVQTTEWHAITGQLGSAVGERFNWTLAAQAFLFGAATAVTPYVQPEHYTAVLVILPVLGLALSLVSMAQILETFKRHQLRRQILDQMVRAKLQAWDNILTQLDYVDRSTQDTSNALVRSQSLLDALVVFVSFLFFASWTVLLVNESQSTACGCGSWWENTCQGSDSRGKSQASYEASLEKV